MFVILFSIFLVFYDQYVWTLLSVCFSAMSKLFVELVFSSDIQRTNNSSVAYRSIILNNKTDQDILKVAFAKEGKVRSNINWHSQSIILESAQHKLEQYPFLGRLSLFPPTSPICRAICLYLPLSLFLNVALSGESSLIILY